MRSTEVYLDEGFGPFPAEVQDHRWNGFLVPRFTREVALQVAEASNRCAADFPFGVAHFTIEGEVIVQHDPPYDEGEPSEITRHEPDADGRYWIGAMEWCWYEIEQAAQ